MKKVLGGVLALCLVMPGSLFAAEADKAAELTEFGDKLSYSIGLDIGQSLKTIGDDVKLETVLLGLTDAFTGKDPKLTPEQVQSVQQEFAAKMQAKKQAELLKMQEENAKAGAAYLEENKKKDGVKVTESGLQYEVIKEGDGAMPKASDTVKVDYVGTLVNGTEFDSSVKRGEPAVFGVGQVIPGWTEALQLMKTGSKYKIVIPSDLAYGEKGAPPVIEPNSVLIFEVELHSIETPEAPAEEKKAE